MGHARTQCRRTLRAGERGITIIETLAAAAILSLAIAGLSNVAANSAAVHKSSQQKEAALRAIEQQLAVITATPIANIPGTYANTGFDVTLDGAQKTSMKALTTDADGQAGYVLVTAPTGNAAELVEVVVGVDWQGMHGTQSVSRRVRVSRLGSN
jgi:Tfp pilus assembly protein PilV